MKKYIDNLRGKKTLRVIFKIDNCLIICLNNLKNLRVKTIGFCKPQLFAKVLFSIHQYFFLLTNLTLDLCVQISNEKLQAHMKKDLS